MTNNGGRNDHCGQWETKGMRGKTAKEVFAPTSLGVREIKQSLALLYGACRFALIALPRLKLAVKSDYKLEYAAEASFSYVCQLPYPWPTALIKWLPSIKSFIPIWFVIYLFTRSIIHGFLSFQSFHFPFRAVRLVPSSLPSSFAAILCAMKTSSDSIEKSVQRSLF